MMRKLLPPCRQKLLNGKKQVNIAKYHIYDCYFFKKDNSNDVLLQIEA